MKARIITSINNVCGNGYSSVSIRSICFDLFQCIWP